MVTHWARTRPVRPNSRTVSAVASFSIDNEVLATALGPDNRARPGRQSEENCGLARSKCRVPHRQLTTPPGGVKGASVHLSTTFAEPVMFFSNYLFPVDLEMWFSTMEGRYSPAEQRPWR